MIFLRGEHEYYAKCEACGCRWSSMLKKDGETCWDYGTCQGRVRRVVK